MAMRAARGGVRWAELGRAGEAADQRTHQGIMPFAETRPRRSHGFEADFVWVDARNANPESFPQTKNARLAAIPGRRRRPHLAASRESEVGCPRGAAKEPAEVLDQLQPALAGHVQSFQDWRQFIGNGAALVLAQLPTCPIDQTQVIGKGHRQTAGIGGTRRGNRLTSPVWRQFERTEPCGACRSARRIGPAAERLNPLENRRETGSFPASWRGSAFPGRAWEQEAMRQPLESESAGSSKSWNFRDALDVPILAGHC